MRSLGAILLFLGMLLPFGHPSQIAYWLTRLTSMHIILLQKMLRCLARWVRPTYVTFYEKPIGSFGLQEIIDVGSEFAQYPYHDWTCPVEVSIFVGAAFFRLTTEVMIEPIRHLKWVDSGNPKRLSSRWLEKIFLVDLKRQTLFYNQSPQWYQQKAQLYSFPALFSNALKTYLSLNYIRACHQLATWPEHLQFFKAAHCFIISAPDPYFVLPIGIALLVYRWITRSQHPFLINLTQPHNRYKCVRYAFAAGMLTAPLSSSINLGIMGMGAAHLLIRMWNK